MARGKRNLITNKFTYVFTQTFLHKHLNLLYDKCLQGVAVILILKEREAYEVWLVIPNPIIFNIERKRSLRGVASHSQPNNF